MDKRKMPTRAQILAHWRNDLFDAPITTDVCWACGTKSSTERAHILDRVKGGVDEPSNLVLLCRPCHTMQEVYVGRHGHNQFAERVKDGALFMAAKMMYYKSIIDG